MLYHVKQHYFNSGAVIEQTLNVDLDHMIEGIQDMPDVTVVRDGDTAYITQELFDGDDCVTTTLTPITLH